LLVKRRCLTVQLLNCWLGTCLWTGFISGPVDSSGATSNPGNLFPATFSSARPENLAGAVVATSNVGAGNAVCPNSCTFRLTVGVECIYFINHVSCMLVCRSHGLFVLQISKMWTAGRPGGGGGEAWRKRGCSG
jgi:hypothetical protein